MIPPRILIVEDETAIAEFYKQTLITEGYEVLVTHTGEDALTQQGLFDPHLILLDVNLGVGIDGFRVIQRLRQSKSEVCIVVLSARHSHFDVAGGLDLGADNYIVKPIGPVELVARVNAEMRPIRRRLEAGTLTEQSFRVGNEILQFRKNNGQFGASLLFKNGRGQLKIENRQKNLSEIEYKVVLRLLRTPGEEVSFEELLKAGWNYAGQPTRNDGGVVDSLMYRLRRKFEDDEIVSRSYGGGYAIRPPKNAD